MIEIQDLKQIRIHLDRFLEEFDDCIKTAPSRCHLRTYIECHFLKDILCAKFLF